MPDFDYTGLKAVAENLVGSFGKDVTITHIEPGTFSPGPGTSSGDVTTNQTIRAVSLPASGGKIAALDARYKLGGVVFEKYAFIIIAGNDISFEPLPGDSVSMDSLAWVVLGVTPTRPNTGNGIIYELALRI